MAAEQDWHGSKITLEELRRWTDNGATWRPLVVTDQRVVLDLCSCTGEAMERVHGEAAELIDYVRNHPPD